MAKVTFTVEQVVALMANGLSKREAARTLGRESQESTIRDMLKRDLENKNLNSVEELIHHYGYDEWANNQEKSSGRASAEVIDLVKNSTFSYNKAKILFLDIETAPLKAHLWSMWQQGVGLGQIESDWYILSYTAKWADSEDVIYRDIRHTYDSESDEDILDELWGLLDDADFVVGHNVKKFDLKKINARFILNGKQPPSTYRVIDTLLIAKAIFGFTSNKLEYLTDKLCKVYKKSKHGKFPGHKLWVECLKGNMEAWDEMEEYNKFDVLSNQELYEILMPWDKTLPNFDIYAIDDVDLSDWKEDGFHHTNLGIYKRYRHKVTGQQRRGRTNMLSKEQRENVLSNIL